MYIWMKPQPRRITWIYVIKILNNMIILPEIINLEVKKAVGQDHWKGLNNIMEIYLSSHLELSISLSK